MAAPRKLTDEQRQQMRDEYAAGGVTQAALARRYGVGQQTISKIVDSRTPDERFWSKVDVIDDDHSCWLWTAVRSGYPPRQYGFIKIGGKNVKAHRHAYELKVGPIGDAYVLHRCDTPLCVRPDHLFLGTHADNMKDRGSKERQARGDRHWATKATADQVREVRHLREQGLLYKEIAEQCGLSKGIVGNILRGTTWGWLE